MRLNTFARNILVSLVCASLLHFPVQFSIAQNDPDVSALFGTPPPGTGFNFGGAAATATNSSADDGGGDDEGGDEDQPPRKLAANSSGNVTSGKKRGDEESPLAKRYEEPLPGADPTLIPHQEPDPDELPVEPQADPNRQKFITLYMGVENTLPVDFLPEDILFKGDYRKVTKVEKAKGLKSLRFTPRTEGLGTLSVLDKKGRKIYEFRITVTKTNLTKVAREIRALLQDVEGIEIKIVNNRILVDGLILTARDMIRVRSVILQFPPDIATTIVRFNPLALQKIAQVIQAEVGDERITVRAVGDRLLLEGTVPDVKSKERAEKIAEMYIPDGAESPVDGLIKAKKQNIIYNLIAIQSPPPPDPKKMLQVVIHFVELNKDYSKGFTFDWRPTITDNSGIGFQADSRQPGGFVSTITGTINNLLPKLNWAKQHGYARVLHSGQLLVQDGQTGNLVNGSKYPVYVPQPNGIITTEYIDANLTMNVTPSIVNAGSNMIQMGVDFSMNSPLGGGVISQKQIKTVILIQAEKSAAIGGLVTNDSGTDYNKIPPGGPAAGNVLLSLYASKAFRRNQSQFVVFITPVIKATANQGSEKILKKFRMSE